MDLVDGLLREARLLRQAVVVLLDPAVDEPRLGERREGVVRRGRLRRRGGGVLVTLVVLAKSLQNLSSEAARSLRAAPRSAPSPCRTGQSANSQSDDFQGFSEIVLRNHRFCIGFQLFSDGLREA